MYYFVIDSLMKNVVCGGWYIGNWWLAIGRGLKTAACDGKPGSRESREWLRFYEKQGSRRLGDPTKTLGHPVSPNKPTPGSLGAPNRWVTQGKPWVTQSAPTSQHRARWGPQTLG